MCCRNRSVVRTIFFLIHFLWKIVFDAMSLFVSVYVRNFSFQNDGFHSMKIKNL